MSEGIRPWGFYKVLKEDSNCKVKEIVVYPGNKLSYQSHNKRNEDWTVVAGSGILVLDGVEHRVSKGEHYIIPAGSKHRMINDSAVNLVFIEIQTGVYFGEDDIIRYEDDYGRANE